MSQETNRRGITPPQYLSLPGLRQDGKEVNVLESSRPHSLLQRKLSTQRGRGSDVWQRIEYLVVRTKGQIQGH